MIRVPSNIQKTGCLLAFCFGLGFLVQTATMNAVEPRIEHFEKEHPSDIGRGFNALVKPGALTILGEVHGTREVPQLILELARADFDVPIVIGIEAPESMNSQLIAFMSSGSPVDTAALLNHPFWKARDGRSSQALLQLLIELRKQRAEGRPINVFAFDAVDNLERSRDEGMAHNIIKKLDTLDTDRFAVLIVSGNLHARTDSRRWMGWHIREVYPHMVSLNNAFSGGTAWICTDNGCGPTMLKGSNRGKKPFVERHNNDERWQGIFYLGAINASPPVFDNRENVKDQTFKNTLPDFRN